MWFKPVKLGGVTADTVTGADLSDTLTGADFRPGSLESALHWQVIWPRIIAKAWGDENIPRRGEGESARGDRGLLRLSPVQQPQADDRGCPSTATFKPEDNNPDTKEDPWSKLPPLELTIFIPPAPEPALQAVAITAYQDTGRSYPFTCCC